MPNPGVLTAIAAISSTIGILATMAYFFLLSQTRRIDTSIRETIEGDGLFNARQVLEILRSFKDDTARLQALEKLADVDTKKARALLDKVKSNVDLEAIRKLTGHIQVRMAGLTAVFFLLVGGLAIYARVHRVHDGREYTYSYSDPNGNAVEGIFRELEGGSWVEFTKEADRDLTYYFREVEGEPGWITLYDSGRKSYVRLRTGGGWCQYGLKDDGPWMNIHRVVPRS